MSALGPSLAITPTVALPAAHLAGWLWTAYLLPVLIVLVPLVKNQTDLRKKKRQGVITARKRRR